MQFHKKGWFSYRENGLRVLTEHPVRPSARGQSGTLRRLVQDEFLTTGTGNTWTSVVFLARLSKQITEFAWGQSGKRRSVR